MDRHIDTRTDDMQSQYRALHYGASRGKYSYLPLVSHSTSNYVLRDFFSHFSTVNSLPFNGSNLRRVFD